MKASVRRFVGEFVRELREQNAAVFAGAGLSAPAGYVNWSDLLRPLAEDLGLSVELETDLVAVAQFVVNRNMGNRSRLTRRLIQEFDIAPKPTPNHALLAQLPISTFWTTNYDKLIEAGLRARGKTVDVKYRTAHLSITKPKRDAVVYKMHGDVDQADEAVLTRRDYEVYPSERSGFVTALTGDLLSKTFLFLGFSFSDPNLEYILSRVRACLGANQREHYAFFKNRERRENESDEEFKHALVRQDLWIQDLKTYNIEVLLIDDYDEITEALEEVNRRFRSRTVFVSGSADSYEPWGQERSENFLVELGAELAARDYRVASGFGLGIGTALLTGVIERVRSDAVRNLEDAMLVRPFPLTIADEAERSLAWEAYRRDVISEAGVSVFIFGNKSTEAGIVTASGVIREFEIARELGLVVLPVGATGSASRQLWSVIWEDFTAYYPRAHADFKAAFESLGRDTDDLLSLVAPIIGAISLAAEGAANGA